MVILAPILFCFWKFVKGTRLVRPEAADLVWERPIVDSYERSTLSKPQGFWAEMGEWVGLRKRKVGDVEVEG
jgi:amino acid transporter